MTYAIQIIPSAEKDLADIPERERRRVVSAIRTLAADPRPLGSLKMAGFDDTHRIRVGGYRVGYRIFDRELVVCVVAAGKRADIYPLVKRRLR